MSDPQEEPNFEELVSAVGERRRILFAGASGTGKSTLLSRIAGALHSDGRAVFGLFADPGRPECGPPGALSIARREDDGWERLRTEGVGTLDALRFRLPVLSAVARLMRNVPEGILLVDPPGVARGVGSAELIRAICDTCEIETAIVLRRSGEKPDFLDMLRACVPDVQCRAAPSEARSPTVNQRAIERTEAWEAFLESAEERTYPADYLIEDVFDHEDAGDWPGRQVVLLDADGGTAGLGEVVEQAGVEFRVRARLLTDASVRSLLARDAGRNERGRLRTRTVSRSPTSPRKVQRAGGFTLREKPDIPIVVGGAPQIRGASVKASVTGGLFGDPMVVLRLDHRRRCLLFDMGEVENIPTRIVHEATDIFVTHCHLDHVSDFPWLFRKRMGYSDLCRLYGPPGFHERFAAMVNSFTWDRVDHRAPQFEVAEVDADELRWARITLGQKMEHVATEPLEDGVLLDDPRFRVRAVELDHGIPVLAFAMEESSRFDVRPERLAARGWKPGPWLGVLKNHAARRELSEVIELPNGERHRVEELMDELLLGKAGQKIAYATDFSDTPENRRRVVELARDAHIFFCEAAFSGEHQDQADRTGHLTGRSCGEIAAEANVGKLIPFHFSSRYVANPEVIYAEILEVFDGVVVPSTLWERVTRGRR